MGRLDGPSGGLVPRDASAAEDELLSALAGEVSLHTGIRLSPAVSESVRLCAGRLASARGASVAEVVRGIVPGSTDFSALVSAVTTNETYFFREERQFALLAERVFPLFRSSRMVIWSAACSSGEEALSLCALARSCGVQAAVCATDIDGERLDFFRRGEYGAASFCSDGSAFRPLLESSGCGVFLDGGFRADKDVLDSLTVAKHNLASSGRPPLDEPADLVFLRNAFIYFDTEVRRSVLARVADCLAPGGMLFLSASEIGCVDRAMLPPGMAKFCCGPVYFLMKEPFGLAERICAEDAVPLACPGFADPEPAPVPARRGARPASCGGESSGSGHADSLSAREVFGRINRFLGEGDTASALAEARGYEPFPGDKVFAAFFNGYAEAAAGNAEAAQRFFFAAETLSPDFWPAYFHHGMLLRDAGRSGEAARCFRSCADCIRARDRSRDGEFDFVTESFSEEYFLDLCAKFAEG